MSWKRTFHTAWTSYAATAGMIVASLLTIRAATRYLSQQEFGLWNFTMQTVGYFLLLDFGVASALGRLFGEPLAGRNESEANGWFNLALAILCLQAALITGVGFFLRDWVIHWFNIPEPLRAQASSLWTVFLIIQAVNLVLRLNAAILYAQNRAYLANILPVIGLWIALGVFILMLHRGAGVMAYAWSSGVGVLVWGILGSAAVAFGPNRFSLRFDGIRKGMVGELFSYSSAVFVIAIAIQVLLMGQTLVAIKILGITAGAVYAVTSRAPIMAMQLVWQPFDAFAPRWQQAFCSGATNKIRQEFSMMARISLLFATFAFVALILVNPPFVRWWTKPEYFGGQTLNVLLAVYLLFQTGTHCFAYAFTLHKQMRLWTAIEIIAVLLCLAGMIAAVPRLGLAGIPAALIAVNVAGGFWFVVAKGGRLMGVRAGQIARKDAIFVISTLALGASFAIWDPLRGRTGGVVMFLSACTLAVTASIPVLLRIFLLLKAMSTQRALPQEAMDAPAPTLS